MNDELVTLAIRLILMVISIVITSYVAPWLKAKTEAEEYNKLITFIKACVSSAEKMYTPEEWKNKKTYVLTLTEKKLESLGINVSADELNSLIEGMVYQIKENK